MPACRRPQRRPKGELSGPPFGRAQSAGSGTALSDVACLVDFPLGVVAAGPAATGTALVTVAVRTRCAAGATPPGNDTTPPGNDTANGESGVGSSAACASAAGVRKASVIGIRISLRLARGVGASATKSTPTAPPTTGRDAVLAAIADGPADAAATTSAAALTAISARATLPARAAVRGTVSDLLDVGEQLAGPVTRGRPEVNRHLVVRQGDCVCPPGGAQSHAVAERGHTLKLNE